MRVLGCFVGSQRHLRMVEISRKTGLPTSTVHRILTELCALSALERTPAGYRVALHLYEIGMAAFTQEELYLAAGPVMQDTVRRTGENVQLSVLDGVDVVVVAKLSGAESRTLISHPGTRLPALKTASGRAMLAHCAPDVVERVIHASRPLPGPSGRDKEFAESLRNVRRDGVAVSENEIREGTTAIAAPVFNGKGEVAAALSIIGSGNTMGDSSVKYLVRVAASAMTISLAKRQHEARNSPHRST
jgi:DNA-binding IclR family transcriptional regulator